MAYLETPLLKFFIFFSGKSKENQANGYMGASSNVIEENETPRSNKERFLRKKNLQFLDYQ